MFLNINKLQHFSSVGFRSSHRVSTQSGPRKVSGTSNLRISVASRLVSPNTIKSFSVDHVHYYTSDASRPSRFGSNYLTSIIAELPEDVPDLYQLSDELESSHKYIPVVKKAILDQNSFPEQSGTPTASDVHSASTSSESSAPKHKSKTRSSPTFHEHVTYESRASKSIMALQDAQYSEHIQALKGAPNPSIESSLFYPQVIECKTFEQFEQVKREMQDSPIYDRFRFSASALLALDNMKVYTSHLVPYSESLCGSLNKEFREATQVLIETSVDQIQYAPPFDGDKLDIAVSVIPSEHFELFVPVLRRIILFMEAGGRFYPMPVPSTWRKTFAMIANLATQHHFTTSNPRIVQACEFGIAIFNHIYLNQLEYTNHGLPKRTEIEIAKQLAKLKKVPLLERQLEHVDLSTKQAPLICAVQTISSILAMLGLVAGHESLRKAAAASFTRLCQNSSLYPPRRIIMISSLFYIWGYETQAQECLSTLLPESSDTDEPSVGKLIEDPKSFLYEMKACELFVTSENANALQDFVMKMIRVNGHVPAPQILHHILWSVENNQKYDMLVEWWNLATVKWRKYIEAEQFVNRTPKKPLHQQQNWKIKRMRSAIDMVLSLQDSKSLISILEAHSNSEVLQKVFDDIFEIFGHRAPGYRSKMIEAYAKDRDYQKVWESIATFDQNWTKKPPTTETETNDNCLLVAKILLTMIDNGDFDSQIGHLMETQQDLNYGRLIDFVSSLLPNITEHNDALKYLPFLNWVASWPYPDGTKSDFEGAEEILKNVKNPQILMIQARSFTRLIDTAGFTGSPALVASLIKRIGIQFAAQHGGTLPISSIWIEPLIKAHAYAGNTETVFHLLSTLGDKFLVDEREIIWKAAFKAYIKKKNVDAAIQLILALRSGKVDSQLPTWSGGYTMSIQLLINHRKFEDAIKMYNLMIDDEFELRDKAIVHNLIEYLKEKKISKENAKVGQTANNVEESEMTESASAEHEYSFMASYNPLVFSLIDQKTLDRLVALEPTLDDSVPNSRLAPGNSARRRAIANLKKRNSAFISQLDRAMDTYYPKKSL